MLQSIIYSFSLFVKLHDSKTIFFYTFYHIPFEYELGSITRILLKSRTGYEARFLSYGFCSFFGLIEYTFDVSLFSEEDLLSMRSDSFGYECQYSTEYFTDYRLFDDGSSFCISDSK